MDDGKMFYKGEPLEINVDDTTSVMYYKHIYRSTFGTESGKHMCLQWGDWCWKQAFHRPDEAIKFLLKGKKDV